MDDIIHPTKAAASRVEGAAGPLDLNFGHISNCSIRRAVRPWSEKESSWFVPSEGWTVNESGDMVVKVQPFAAGGFEAIAKKVDIPGLARMLDAPRKTGKREKPDEQSDDDIQRSMRRSKTKVRHLVKSLGCDRLLTLTRRESDPDHYWTMDEWKAAWRRFTQLCQKAGVELQYVAVPERHKKGNIHLHAAVRGYLQINTMRQNWWLCCGGRGMGNIDVSYKKDMDAATRHRKLSHYLSKYISKQFENSEFNKKRYWATKHALPAPYRLVMFAKDGMEALAEFAERYALDLRALMGLKAGVQGVYAFTDGLGWWMESRPMYWADPPF